MARPEAACSPVKGPVRAGCCAAGSAMDMPITATAPQITNARTPRSGIIRSIQLRLAEKINSKPQGLKPLMNAGHSVVPEGTTHKASELRLENIWQTVFLGRGFSRNIQELEKQGFRPCSLNLLSPL